MNKKDNREKANQFMAGIVMDMGAQNVDLSLSYISELVDDLQTLLDEARIDEAKRAHRRFKKANTCSAGDLCDRDQCCSEGSVTIADVNAELEKLKNRISKLKDETTTDS